MLSFDPGWKMMPIWSVAQQSYIDNYNSDNINYASCEIYNPFDVFLRRDIEINRHPEAMIEAAFPQFSALGSPWFRIPEESSLGRCICIRIQLPTFLVVLSSFFYLLRNRKSDIRSTGSFALVRIHRRKTSLHESFPRVRKTLTRRKKRAETRTNICIWTKNDF